MTLVNIIYIRNPHMGFGEAVTILSCVEFIRKSLELHLFFARIMKEHALLLEVGLLHKNFDLICRANAFRVQFERLLSETVSLGNGNLSPDMLLSGEVITPYTLRSEIITEHYTGIPLQTDITLAEANLSSGIVTVCNPMLEQGVFMLNMKALRLLSAMVQFKASLLSDVLSCKIYIFYYPLIIEHILDEAKLYYESVLKLQNLQETCTEKEYLELVLFWNNREAEHSIVFAGLLDPRERELIKAINSFGDSFSKLAEDTEQALDNPAMASGVINDSLATTSAFRDFVAEAVHGLIDCKVKSIIMPLAADHVLRETNHYLYILRQISPSFHTC